MNQTSIFEKILPELMAYLPGERPTLNPWQSAVRGDLDPVKDSHSGLRPLNLTLNVAGPGSSYIEWGVGESSTKLVVLIRGM